MKHSNGTPQCPSCEDKLAQAHLRMIVWYRKVKEFFPELHISCSFRGQAEQESDFLEGKSEKHWPDSRHNKQPAEALDVFKLSDDGRGFWPPTYFAEIAHFSKDEPIRWGGDFPHLRDFPHFELHLDGA